MNDGSCNLRGSLSPLLVLSGSLTQETYLNAKISPVGNLTGTLSMFSGEYQTYSGPYSAVPSFEDQVLNTSNKVLYDDINISRIAVHEVSNLSGGITVYIGGDINYG